MSRSADLLRACRVAAGMTQTELGRRLGVTQPTVAALERPDSNPRIATLERAIAATGHSLQVIAPALGATVDASLVRDHLKRSPAQRLAVLDDLHAQNAWLGSARRV